MLFIPGDGVLYVAPRLITHYVRKHGYQPPAAFLEAVLAQGDHLVSRRVVTSHLIGHVEQPSERYTAADITVLEGLEVVRRRPGMFIGPPDSRGLEEMVLVIVALLLDGHLTGTSTRLSVQIDHLGWVTISDDGDGISVEPGPRKQPPWIEVALSRIGMVPPRHQELVHSSFAIRHGPDPFLSPGVVAGLSARLEFETRRDGRAWRFVFSSGHPIQALTDTGPTSQRGTVVRYRPDDELFPANATHDLDAIEKRLRAIALVCPRLDVRFQDRSLQCPDGLATWLREAAPELVKETTLTAKGTANDIDVEATFAWRPRATAPLVRSFVNYGETIEGGSHVRGLTLAIENVIAAKRASRVKKVLGGIVGAVHVGVRHPQLHRGQPFEDKNVRTAVRDVVTRAINEAPWWWDRLHTAIG